MNSYDPNAGKIRCRVLCTIARWIATPFLLIFGDFHPKRYKPKAKTFILVANHVQSFDPGYEMICVHKYMRFIASDHLERVPVAGRAIRFFGGVLFKHRDRLSSELTDEIIASVKAGVPVAIHAEGAMSKNGETGFVSAHTGQLIKDSGVALITAQNIGGYLRAPRWAKNKRKGPAFTRVVAEYSPDQLAEMTAEEITDIIRRDIYVNIYDEQRKDPHEYTGKALCEELERSIYVCPMCESVGTMRSSGDTFACSKCGYKVGMDTHGFFTDIGSGVIFDNIADWDRAQKRIWRKQVEASPEGKVIIEERKQKVYKVVGGKQELLSSDAVLRLYPDSFWLIFGGKKGSVTLPFDKIDKVLSVSATGLVIVGDDYYYDIRSDAPRCAEKYVAAWRWKTGREYL